MFLRNLPYGPRAEHNLFQLTQPGELVKVVQTGDLVLERVNKKNKVKYAWRTDALPIELGNNRSTKRQADAFPLPNPNRWSNTTFGHPDSAMDAGTLRPPARLSGRRFDSTLRNQTRARSVNCSQTLSEGKSATNSNGYDSIPQLSAAVCTAPNALI